MTSPNSPDEADFQEPQNQNDTGSWFRKIALATGIALVGMGTVGYFVTDFWIRRELPSLVETQLGNFLNRKVDIGEVQNWSLTGIRFSSSSLPATAEDPNQVSITTVDVNFNPIPVIFSRNLPVDITLIKPEVYLQQGKQGEWSRFDLALEDEGELPVKLDTTLRVRDAKVSLLPRGYKTPLESKLNGSVNYSEVDSKHLQYDLDAEVFQGKVKVKGKTQLENGKTLANAKIEKLTLAKLNPFLPQIPLNISNGEFDADLKIELPTFSDLPLVVGTANLQKLKVKSKQLPVPINADAVLQFAGQKVSFEKTKGSYGSLTALLSGDMDLNKGFNLKVDVNPFGVRNVLKTVPVKLPVGIDGKLRANMALKGKFDNPILTGNIFSGENVRGTSEDSKSATDTIIVDKAKFSKINASFVGDLSQFLLKEFRATPISGGEVVAKGNVKFPQRLTEVKHLEVKNLAQSQLAFNVNANLSNPGATIAPYGVTNDLVKLSEITAVGSARGTLQNPQAVLSWKLPNADTAVVGKVSGAGDILYAANKVSLRNTTLETEDGKVNVDGEANLANNIWQGSVNANALSLTPLLSKLQQSQTSVDVPLFLERGNINLAGKLDNFQPASIDANAKLDLNVNGGKVAVDGVLNRGIILANASTNRVSLNKFLPQLGTSVTLADIRANASGSLQQLLSFATNNNQKNQSSNKLSDRLNNKLNSFRAVTSGKLIVSEKRGRGTINFNGRGDLGSETWEASINANSVTLNPFLSGFQSPQLNLNRPINLRQGKVKLAGNLDILDNLNPENIDLAKVQAIADLDLDVNNGKVAIDSKLERGLVEAIATAKGISVSPFLPDLPVPVTIADSQVNFSGSVNRLLSQGVDNIRANAIARLGVQGGTVNTVTKLNNGIFSSNTTATNINTPAICQNFDLSCPEVGKLSGKFNLAGNINPFIEGNSPATIQAKNISLQAGEQSLTADGQISLNPNPTTSKNATWGIGTNLNVNARSNLNKLPSTLIARISEQTNIPIAGNAAFQGRFQGDNLLADPLAAGNLQLTGNLQLRDFAVDKIAFEPLLKGPVNLQPGKTLGINLQGQKDQIAAQLEPCNKAECLLPYLPVSFNLRQGGKPKDAIIVNGKRNGDRFNIELENFSLALLNLIPTVKDKLKVAVGGIVTGELDLNLFNFATAGNLKITEPSLANIKAKEAAAKFSYDGGIAKVQSSYLEVGQSRYNLQGDLNLNSGDVDAKIFTKSAEVQDIFTVLDLQRLEDLERVVFGFGVAKASVLKTRPLGEPNASLAEKLRLLEQTDLRLQNYKKSLKQQQPIIPFDLRGKYDAEIKLAGNLYNPQIDLQLDGNNWELRPLGEFMNTQFPKGSVNQAREALTIKQVTARANYKDGKIRVDPLRVAFAEGLIALQGELTTTKTSGFVQVQNFSLTNLEKFGFLNFPADIGGKVNLQAKVGGTIYQPQISEGKVSVVDGSFNKQLLGEFSGNFSYIDSVATFNTTPDSFAQINAKIPYPSQPSMDNSMTLDAIIGTQPLALLSSFTDGQVEWVKGDGGIALKVEGPLNWSAQTPFQRIKDLSANSTIKIQNAAIKTKQLGEEINLDIAGNVALQNQTIKAEQLEGEIAGSPFSLTGVLPLVEDVNRNQADPLILALGPGKVNFKGIYKGNLNANIEILRTAMRPIIGGEINLDNGRIILPKQHAEGAAEREGENLQKQPVRQTASKPNANSFSFEPSFKDLQIIIGDGFRFKQSVPRTNFLIAGDLTLNGTLDNLKPEGIINLRRGSIYFLDNSFFLSRDREHFIVFSPDQGLFNPHLDMELQTIVVDARTFDRLQPVDSEIRDDAIAPTNSDQVDIRIGIEGEASQLIGSLDNSSCQINSPPVIPTSSVVYSPERLKQIEDCINKNSRVAIQNQKLLNNPVVELSSTPNRNQTEILSLLGNRTVAIVKEVEQKLADGQEEELIRSAFVDYVVLPIADDYYQEFLWNVQRPVNSVGKKIGLTRLQVFPSVAGLKDINENSSVRFIYNYDFGEFRVEYQRRF